ncbi:hypothetical protein [Halorussus sp. AFM4]|uniref:hypothetical protein n=1 Tax=Halorussus sp. AFM4 TaxID=3421651 RepID=UPI003EBBA558
MERRVNATTTREDPSDRGAPFATVAVRRGTGARRGDGAAGDPIPDAIQDADALPDADDARPRTVRVRNAAAEPRQLTVEVARGAGILVDRTVEFPADGVLELVLYAPGDYRVLAGLPDGERTALAVDRSAFRGGASTPELTVLPDGRVEATPDGTTGVEAVQRESASRPDTARDRGERRDGRASRPRGRGRRRRGRTDAPGRRAPSQPRSRTRPPSTEFTTAPSSTTAPAK